MSHNARVLSFAGAFATLLVTGCVAYGLMGERAAGLTCPLCIIVVIVWVRLLRSLETRQFQGFIARSIVAEGLCGQCLYELVGTTQQTSGMVKCPECGASWLAERWKERTLARARSVAGDAQATSIASDRDAFLRWCLTHRKPEWIIADDRGTFTYAPKSWLDEFPEPPSSDAERDALARLSCEIRAAARPRRQKATAVIALLSLVMISAMVWAILDDRAHSREDPIFAVVFLVLVLAFVTAVILVVNASELGIPPREVALCLAASGRCGACAHTLQTAQIQSALRVCPKCHAAWFVPNADGP